MGRPRKGSNPVGRPLKYRTAKELQKKIDEYFLGSLKSMTGLALFLGFQDRNSMHDYEKRGEFSGTIKRARARIEEYYEQLMVQVKNPSGCIFALKNFGWSDRQEIQHEGSITNIIRLPPKKAEGADVDTIPSAG